MRSIDIIKTFESLGKPNADKTYVYTAETITPKNWRIAKDIRSCPAFLIPHNEILTQCVNLDLEYIEVIHNVKCTIQNQSDKTITNCSIISLKRNDTSVVSLFIHTVYGVLENISSIPAELNSAIETLRKLFSKIEKSGSKTVQGLWAELLIISESNSPEDVLQYWHFSNDDLYDFHFESDRLEVKSCLGEKRIHAFSQNQLSPSNSKLRVMVASVMMKRSYGGQNISQLIESLLRRISSPSLARHLVQKIIESLGKDIETSEQFRYDYNYSKENLNYYDVFDIPRIEPEYIPDEIFDLRYKSDLTGLSTQNPLDLGGNLFESIPYNT